MPYKTKRVIINELRLEDIVIAVMGSTGSGKSQVIDTLTGQGGRASASLLPATRDVFAYRVLGHEKYGNKLVLVDTPALGLGDTRLNEWMTETYKRGVTLAGIIYTQKITDHRIGGSVFPNPIMFRKICADKLTINIVILTTMWDEVGRMEQAEKQETNLKETFWNVMIHHGATIGRFYLKELHGSKSPWIIVDKMIQRHRAGQALVLREELVYLGKRFGKLNKTSTENPLSQHLEDLLNRANQMIKSIGEIEGERMDANFKAGIESLRVQYEIIRSEIIMMEVAPGRNVQLANGKPIRKKGKANQLQLIAVLLLALATLWQMENKTSSSVYLIYLLCVTLT